MQKRHPTTGQVEGEEEGDDIQAGSKDGKGALDKYSGVKVRLVSMFVFCKCVRTQMRVVVK